MIDLKNTAEVGRKLPPPPSLKKTFAPAQPKRRCLFCNGSGQVLVNLSGLVGDQQLQRCPVCGPASEPRREIVSKEPVGAIDENHLAIAIGRRVRACRSQGRLTPSALAERVGEDAAWITLLERGQRVPTIAQVYRLALALGKDPLDLLPDPSKIDVEALVPVSVGTLQVLVPIALAEELERLIRQSVAGSACEEAEERRATR